MWPTPKPKHAKPRLKIVAVRRGIQHCWIWATTVAGTRRGRWSSTSIRSLVGFCSPCGSEILI
eukprot:11558493-Prorocentrum_lima.AAC.1